MNAGVGGSPGASVLSHVNAFAMAVSSAVLLVCCTAPTCLWSLRLSMTGPTRATRSSSSSSSSSSFLPSRTNWWFSVLYIARPWDTRLCIGGTHTCDLLLLLVLLLSTAICKQPEPSTLNTPRTLNPAPYQTLSLWPSTIGMGEKPASNSNMRQQRWDKWDHRFRYGLGKGP